MVTGWYKQEPVINPMNYAYMGDKPVAVEARIGGTRHIAKGQVLGWRALLEPAVVQHPARSLETLGCQCGGGAISLVGDPRAVPRRVGGNRGCLGRRGERSRNQELIWVLVFWARRPGVIAHW
jgi:hypothetical protein